MKTILLIGNGKWGKNYVSALSQFNNVDLIIANRNNWQELVNKCPDGAIIATPPENHIEIAEYILNKKIPIIIEKPLALNYRDCEKLKKYNKIPILVNHIHLFSPIFQQISEMCVLDDIHQITSLGINNGPFRNYSSLMDYGSHDLAMSMFLMKEEPEIHSISKTIHNIDNNIGEIWDIDLIYKNKIHHHIKVGNGGVNKIGKFQVQTTKNSTFLYNYQYPHNLYIDNTYNVASHTLPLTAILDLFLKSIDGYTDERFGVELACNTIKILEKCCMRISK